jgi:PAS domain S-box-containing protein
MKRNPLALEKRIYISYFIITSFLVTMIVLVEWQMVKFSINQHENAALKKASLEISNKQNDFAKTHLLALIKNSEEPIFKHALLSKNSEILKAALPSKSAVVYSSDNRLLAGEYWDFVGSYHKIIFSNSKSGYFFAAFGERPFIIYYIPIYENENLIGYLIDVKSFDLNLSVQESNMIFSLSTFPVNNRYFVTDLAPFRAKIEKFIETMSVKKEQRQILRLSMNLAVLVSIDYDINYEPAFIHFILYYRFINSFAQKSIYFFLIILSCISIIMIGFLGNWFSKSILYPIKVINERMKDIAYNPAILEPLVTSYQGILGEMTTTFNSMNASLKEYSESLEEYKIISDNLNSGIFWLTTDFKVALCNPALLSIFNMSSDNELIGKNLNDFLHLKNLILQKVIEEAITISNFEIKVENKKKYVMINMLPIHSKGRKKIVGSITDVTTEVIEKKAREALEIELLKSNKLAEIGRRVEGIVHNLNSPLNSVLGYAQLLKRNDEHNRDIDKILESGKIISHYVKTLQQKIKKDSVSMQHPVDIVELVKQELALCQHNLFFKHYVELETNFSQDLPPIYVVFGDISLCVANLLNNAIESLEGRTTKKIAVSVFKENDSICVQIKDTGKGIEKKNIEAIFQPYFTTKIEHDAVGYGLGLAICKHVADKYQGKIIVISEPDKGSSFTLMIPIKR